MLERWEGYYQTSDQGRIRSLDRVVRHPRGGPSKRRGQILHANPIGKYGYFVVTLYKEGIRQNIRVHQLVALTWIGPCPNGKEVCHGPNGAIDNSVGNLLYGTHKQTVLICVGMVRISVDLSDVAMVWSLLVWLLLLKNLIAMLPTFVRFVGANVNQPAVTVGNTLKGLPDDFNLRKV